MSSDKSIILDQFEIYSNHEKVITSNSFNEESEKFDEMSSTLLTYKDIITPSERAFLRLFINRISAEGISLELAHQEFIVIQVNKKLRSMISKIAPKSKIARAKFIIKRPDILLAKFGLVIEIDGLIHDKSITKGIKDELSDYEYNTLNLHVYHIPNSEIYSETAIKRHLDNIVQFIKDQLRSNDIKLWKTRRTKILRARKAFKATGTKINIGTYSSNPEQIHYPNFPKPFQKQFGGYRYRTP